MFSHVTMDFRHARTGTLIRAMNDVSLRVAESEFVCLVGPSGCGKSTLLNLVAGFERPTEGVVRFRGEEIAGPGTERGVVFQEHALFPWLTVLGNITFGPRARRLPSEVYLPRARELLAAVGLEGFAHSYPRELSGGMRQRVSIARALMNEPEVLLMDEPFASLDAQTRGLMQELLLRIWQAARRTVIFVTHDVEEATLLADRVIVMTARPGRIKTEITVAVPRPRTSDVVTTQTFVATKRQVTDLVRAEVLASNEAGRPKPS